VDVATIIFYTMTKDNENIFIEPWIEEEGWNVDDFSKIETPCLCRVTSESHLERNLKILSPGSERTQDAMF
jgi:hypothetical protein